MINHHSDLHWNHDSLSLTITNPPSTIITHHDSPSSWTSSKPWFTIINTRIRHHSHEATINYPSNLPWINHQFTINSRSMNHCLTINHHQFIIFPITLTQRTRARSQSPCPRCCRAWLCSGAPTRCAARRARCCSAGDQCGNAAGVGRWWLMRIWWAKWWSISLLVMVMVDMAKWLISSRVNLFDGQEAGKFMAVRCWLVVDGWLTEWLILKSFINGQWQLSSIISSEKWYLVNRG